MKPDGSGPGPRCLLPVRVAFCGCGWGWPLLLGLAPPPVYGSTSQPLHCQCIREQEGPIAPFQPVIADGRSRRYGGTAQPDTALASSAVAACSRPCQPEANADAAGRTDDMTRAPSILTGWRWRNGKTRGQGAWRHYAEETARLPRDRNQPITPSLCPKPPRGVLADLH